ncbi:hypothetical protein Q1695_016051 [Nippostrongylus brasiliensis]|nr:hypothetical protein Q1695_016051 [Nippostrongylus brasiliensis]
MKAQIRLFILALAATTCNGEKACGCGHGLRLFSPPAPPPFMKNVSTEAQMELISVFANESMTIAEQKQAIRIWGEAHGIQKQVEDFEASTRERSSRLQGSVVYLLFNQVKLALERFYDIMSDDEVTWSLRKYSMKQLEAEYPEAVEVLKVAFEQPLFEGIDQLINQWYQYRDHNGHWRIRISN